MSDDLDRFTPAERNVIMGAVGRLEDRYAGIFNRETVERFFADSMKSFESATVPTHVPLLAERFAQERLRALAKADGLVTTTKPSVLFLCVHNAGRSQMAAGWLRQMAGSSVDVYSGGSDPGSQLNATAVAAMQEVGIDISTEYPKPWTDEIVRAADVVVTMGCGDACPILPGKRYVDWELDDPAGRPLEEVRGIRDDIRQRVADLVSQLTSQNA
jgi:protein-tyrosine-phosphatase